MEKTSPLEGGIKIICAGYILKEGCMKKIVLLISAILLFAVSYYVYDNYFRGVDKCKDLLGLDRVYCYAEIADRNENDTICHELEGEEETICFSMLSVMQNENKCNETNESDKCELLIGSVAEEVWVRSGGSSGSSGGENMIPKKYCFKKMGINDTEEYICP